MAASTGPERWLPGRGARRGGSRLALALGLAALGASGLGVAAPSAAAAASVGPRSYDGPEAAPADEAPRGVGADEVPEASASGALVEGPALPAASTTSGPEVDAVALRLTIYRAGERLPDGARTPRRGGAVEGEAVYTLDRPARAGERVRLLNFAEAMTREPIELDTIALSTYLDGPFQPGRLDLLGHEGAASVARVGERRDLEVVLEEGAQELRLRYRVAVPHRYWPFGCARRRCSLSGAIAPLPTEAATGGRYLPADGVAIAPAHWRVESVRFAAAPSWEPGREPTDAEAAALKGDEIVVADAPVGGRGLASYPSVFWGPRWRRVTEIHNGVRIELLHTLWRPGDHYPSERKLQLYRDVPGHVLHAIKDVLDVAAASRVEPPPDTRMVIVQGPLRSSLAEAHPTALLISDQILQVFPMERFLEFHAEVVARGGFDVLAHAFFAGRHAASTDLWLQGSLAMALLDLWRVHRATRDEFASDILGRLTFVPAVDNFLYAGQAEFTAAYFRGSEDTFPVRNHPWLAGNELPTGRRIHEKLRDLVPPAALGAFYQALTRAPDVDPIAAAEEAYGHTLGWFFDQWLGPYPKVDYRIARIASEPERGGWRHRITVARASEAALIEPVQVLVSERSGEHHYLIWNGELGPDGGGEGLDGEPASGEHTFELWTATKLRAVAVDPRARLLETPRPPADNVDPLFNNRRPPGARFLYTGFGLDLAVTEFLAATNPASRLGALSGFAFFEASRRRDLRATGHMMIYRDRETAAGIGAGSNLWFGRKVNRKRRVNRVRLFSNLEYLTDKGLDPRGGLRVTELVAFIHDTRSFYLWPDRGRRIYGLLSGSQVIRVDGLGNDHRYAITADVGWTELWPLAHRHVLASRLEAAMVLPIASDLEFRSLLRAGGIGDLAAYQGNEIFGRALIKTQLEYRHTYYENLDINLLHLAWLRGIGGSLFAGAATVSHCDDYRGLFRRESWYGQVGYGVTAYLRLLGVTPQFFRFDVAVPLVRRQTVCLGRQLPNYLAELQGLEDAQVLLPPVSFNLTFLQPF